MVIVIINIKVKKEFKKGKSVIDGLKPWLERMN